MRAEPAPPGFSRWLAVAGIVLAVAIPVLDGTIVHIALPSMATALGASGSDAIWIVTAYNIAILMGLLPAAGLADRFGHRPLCRTGVVIFTLASAACAASPSLPWLIAARVAQGIGAACIMTTTNALIRQAYGPGRLGRAMSTHAMAVAVSSALGPTVAAVLLLFAPWPILFLVNIPAGVATLAALSLLPKAEPGKHRFDTPSAILCAAFFGLLTLAAGQGLHPLGVIAAVAAVLAAAWLLKRSLASPQPLAPVDLLRHPVFALSMLGSICIFAAQAIALITLPFMIQDGGHSASAAGLLITAWPLCALLASFAAGRLPEARAATTALVGAGVFGLGLLALAAAPQDPAPVDLIWRIALCGLGFGLFQSPNNTVIFAAAPETRGGAAGGMLALARLSGQSLGAGLLGVLMQRLGHGAWGPILLTAALGCGLAMTTGATRLRAASARPTHPSVHIQESDR